RVLFRSVSGTTDEKIVRAIFGEGKSMDNRISDSLCVFDGLIRCFSIGNRGWLRVLNLAFLSFLFGLRCYYLLSPSPRLFDLGYHCNCYFCSGSEAVELG